MNKSVKIFSALFSIALLVACSSAESELLKQARTIQNGLIKSQTQLDSTINVTINAYNKKIETLSADSTLMKDSVGIASFEATQQKIAELGQYRSQLADWVEKMTKLPSVEELAKGVENPFGKDANDQTILKSIQTSQDEFNKLKSEIETALQ
ncbi:MAG: hypothetical protein IT223_02420 [Crocinitomicaceae bacterium]|nr:hypothetical protein [Crocinitomicaceae bacterium]